jgi:hypothetical protein
MSVRPWVQKSFVGGISDDKFQGVANSFRFAKAVETRKNPNSLTLAYEVAKDSGAETDQLVNAFVTIKSTGDIIAFLANGKILRKAGGSGSWTLVYTDTGSASILNAFEFNGNLYWFTAGNVHKIAVADIDASWAGDVTEDFKAFTNGNTNAHPAIELFNKMYVGDGNLLAELDSSEVWTANKLTIFGDEEIRAITFGGTMMRLFARKSNLVDHGAKYLWNGITEAYNERVPFGATVHTAIYKDGVDIVLAGLRPFIYASAGYDNRPIKRLPLVADTQSIFFSPNSIDVFDGNSLIVFGPAESGDGAIPRGIYTWGRENNNYRDSLNFDYPTSNDNVTDVIGAVHQSNGELYMSWKNGANYGIDKIDKTKFRAAGFLQSRVMYGNFASDEKEAIAASIAYATLNAGEAIEVFARKNLAASFPGTAELTADAAVALDLAKNFKKKDEALTIADFTYLETKINLTAGTNQATTPEITELVIDFDDDIEKSDD